MRVPNKANPSLWSALACVALAVVATSCTPPAARRARSALVRGDYGAAKREIDDGLRKAPNNGDLWALNLRLMVANDKRGEALARYRKRPSRELRFALAESVLWWGLRHRDPARRLQAVQAVRAVDGDTLLRSMRQRLEDPDPLVRTWAAVALSRERYGVAVLDKQLHAKDARARAVAVSQVGRIAQSAALRVIARYVDDTSWRVRAAAARALASTEDHKAVKPLLKLVGDRRSDVRLAAVGALGDLGDDDAVAALRAALKDKKLFVRLAAASALGRVSKPAAHKTLAPILSGGPPLMALRAAAVLAKHEKGAALRRLEQSIVHKRIVVRLAALTTIVTIGTPIVRGIARRALRDRQPRVRIAAARAVLAVDRDAALKVARSIESLACEPQPQKAAAAPASQPASAPTSKPTKGLSPARRAELAAARMRSLCIQGATLMARAGDKRGVDRLAKLATGAKTDQQRKTALRWALLRAKGDRAVDLALRGLADKSLDVALVAAEWLYRRDRRL